MGRFFFTRHGPTLEEDCVSDKGKARLEVIRSQLKTLGFEASFVFATSTKRSIKTAEVLAPKVTPIICDHFKVMGGTFGELRAIAREWLPLIKLAYKACGHVLVVTHDALSTAFAYSLIEQNGEKVNWEEIPDSLLKLEQGCGILVVGKSMAILR